MKLPLSVLSLVLSVAGCSAPAVEAPKPEADPLPETVGVDVVEDSDPWIDAPGEVVAAALAEAGVAPIEVLLLGTFHFDDQGLDAYKPTHRFDPTESHRTAEIGEVLDALEAFAPDKICVERRAPIQARLDQAFAQWSEGGLRSRTDEIAVLGFPLAARLGHERLFAIDAEGRWLEPRVDPIAWAQKNGRLGALATPLQAVAERFYPERDRFIDRAPLASIYRFMNHPRVLEVSHAAYLVGPIGAADGVEYPGPDGFVSQWFNRNLRIFSNLRRLAEPGDRVVVLIGAGHVPILRHCVQSSPEFELVEVADVIDTP